MFDDLLKNYQKHNEKPSCEAHFIGSIVILEEKNDRYSRANVIDGQQRLTTFFILTLILLKSYMKNKNIIYSNDFKRWNV